MPRRSPHFRRRSSRIPRRWHSLKVPTPRRSPPWKSFRSRSPTTWMRRAPPWHSPRHNSVRGAIRTPSSTGRRLRRRSVRPRQRWHSSKRPLNCRPSTSARRRSLRRLTASLPSVSQPPVRWSRSPPRSSRSSRETRRSRSMWRRRRYHGSARVGTPLFPSTRIRVRPFRDR